MPPRPPDDSVKADPVAAQAAALSDIKSADDPLLEGDMNRGAPEPQRAVPSLDPTSSPLSDAYEKYEYESTTRTRPLAIQSSALKKGTHFFLDRRRISRRTDRRHFCLTDRSRKNDFCSFLKIKTFK